MKLFDILLFLHFSAVVVWVGGMAAIYFAARPAGAETLEPPQNIPFMAAMLRRFLCAVASAIVVLLVTGTWMMILMGGMSNVPPSVHIMLGLGLAMMAIFGHVRFASYAGLRRAVAKQDWQEGGRRLAMIRRLVAVSLTLGFVIIAVATMGRILA
ncbi:MAG TPA: CopD family protein [Rhodocyclaceae bacterium]|nr:CopD family protein [Rhodocyclaceae bacterium]